MLSKEYLVTGVFPRFSKSTHQLTIRRQDGIPTNNAVRACYYAGGGYIRARHGLRNPINFYAVTEVDGNRLVSISDGEQTRYYWITSRRHDTYLVKKPSRSYEVAWLLLEESLRTDKRLSAELFSKAVRPFFYALPIMI